MKITTKIAVLSIVAAFAAAPAMAKHKYKHKKQTQVTIPDDPKQMTPEQAMAYNKRNLSLIVQGLPLILPSWSMPIYFGMQKHHDEEMRHKKRH
jgi:hypothetical protein